MINKDDLVSLTWEQKRKYNAAIDAGYFDNYEDNPREWQHSFVGQFLMKRPDRTATLNRLRDIVGHIPTWEDLTDDTIADFVTDCTESGMTMSSAKVYCAELKATLTANKRKVPSTEYVDRLNVKAEKSQAVYLTREEINRIIRYSPESRLEQFVRRNFLVGCLTGARHCDAVRLTIDNCDMATGTLSYVPDKTSGIIVTVPVDERMHVRDFLADRYYRECQKHTFNDILRRICRNCHIDTVRSIKTRERNVTAPKYKLVSSHTARRSFATNLYIAGVSIEDIAILMGHGKNIETTKRYICSERPVSTSVMSYFQPQKQEQQ